MAGQTGEKEILFHLNRKANTPLIGVAVIEKTKM